ncbi:MAG: hypothetical protein HY303_12155 [Candidatus Wallbacteria bacterium]|nr:hypothetical protein [Candidatus Wallbacteria bacterium]
MVPQKTRRLATALMLALAVAAPVAAQSSFGNDERFDSEFYGDLRTRSGDRLYNGRDPSSTGYAAAASPQTAAAQKAYSNITQTASVPNEYIPWSGAWWPRATCELSFHSFEGGLSPLEKYDSIVASLYGRLPGAAAWEADPVNHHNYASASTSVDWGGHCNGLAAAGILAPEPKKPFDVSLGNKPIKVKLTIAGAKAAKEYLYSDGQNDYRQLDNPSKSIKLTVADMKGLLSETYMTCNTQQFANRKTLGTRYDRNSIDLNDESFRDIYPHYFHWMLQQYVKKNGMAVVAEIDANRAVNNHPLFKYQSSAAYVPAQRKYSVTTVCTFTHYAKDPNFVGTNTMTRTYTYDLFQDAGGRVVRGEWTGKSVKDHPDFCWIPTSDAPAYATLENQAINGDFVRWMYSRYGKAQ